MKNHGRIDEILRDLDDAKMKPLVEALLSLQPHAQMDEAFRNRLRRELLASASTLPAAEISFAGLFASWGKLAYAGAGALAAILVLVGITYGPSLFVGGNFNNVEVVRIGERAFGDLATQAGGGMGGSAMKGGAESAPTPEGDIAVRATMPSMALGMGGGGTPSSFIYPAPDMPRIDFSYAGEPPAIEETVDVLRRVKPTVSGTGVVTALRRFTLGLLDLSEFIDPNLESFALTEDQPRGYSVYVNSAEGTVSIGQNWRTWPHTDGPTDIAMPSDGELIAIANAFLDERGIARDAYGLPQVQKPWGMAEPLAYASEVSLIYPYLINGETLYDQGGNPTGMYVGVNVRERRVSNISGIMTRRYEASAYEAERDVERLLSYAENRYWYNEGARTVTVPLGVPERVFMNMWTWNGSEGTEVVVPALAFPIPDNLAISNVYLPAHVVVPLAKELLETEAGQVRILQ